MLYYILDAQLFLHPRLVTSSPSQPYSNSSNQDVTHLFLRLYTINKRCYHCNTVYSKGTAGIERMFSQLRNVPLKADSHIACRAHSVPLPFRAAKGLDCVFPIWFTQCCRVWFTLAMPRHTHAAPTPCSDHAVLLKATAQHGRRGTACGLPARVRLLPGTTRSPTKIVIRSIPILLTTIHTYDCKEW
jgi:hypothetical protein